VSYHLSTSYHASTRPGARQCANPPGQAARFCDTANQPARGWIGHNGYVIDTVGVIETPAQLRAVEIAGNLQRITDQLTAPDRDPARLHTQLLGAQRDVVAALTDLNAIVGGPALLPSTTGDPHNGAATR
jgi:hypothetical protein